MTQIPLEVRVDLDCVRVEVIFGNILIKGRVT